jgi:hypothetical protein
MNLILEEQAMRFMKDHSPEEDDHEYWLKWVDHEE